MDLLKKIEKIKNSVDKLKQLTEDLNDSNLSKQKKIDYLKKKIQENIEKIDEIIEKNNANT